MQRVAFFLFVFVLLVCTALTPGGAFAQSTSATASATCNFDEQKQLMLEYQPVKVSLKKPLSTQVALGKVWAPGGKPMTLFTNTPVAIGSRMLPIGAYTMFVLPTAKHWTLIVSKSTDTSGAYDEQQDLVRVPMDSGELPNPEDELSVSFGHVASGQCNLRIDLEKYGHFTAIQEK
jgi:Protein of unknown function (DUF2911)